MYLVQEFLGRHWLIVLLITSLLFSVSCVGVVGCGSSGEVQAADKEFAGDWRAWNTAQGTSTQLSVGHIEEDACQEAGQVYAHGFNSQAAYAWSRLAYTGKVQKTGLARGVVTLWRETTGGAQFKVGAFDLDLNRNGVKLKFELIYKIGTSTHHDKIELTKGGNI